MVLEEADAALLLAPGEEHDVAVRLQALAGRAVPGVRVLQAEYARVHVPRGPQAGVIQALEERVHAVRGVHKVVKGDQRVLAVPLDGGLHVLLEVLLGAQLGLLDGLLGDVDAVVVVVPARLLERRERLVNLLLGAQPDDGPDAGARADRLEVALDHRHEEIGLARARAAEERHRARPVLHGLGEVQLELDVRLVPDVHLAHQRRLVAVADVPVGLAQGVSDLGLLARVDHIANRVVLVLRDLVHLLDVAPVQRQRGRARGVVLVVVLEAVREVNGRDRPGPSLAFRADNGYDRVGVLLLDER